MTDSGRICLLVADGLTYSPVGQQHAHPILAGASMHVDRGEMVDVFGPSGCGKTTLLCALARLLPDASGTLALDGVTASDISPTTWRGRVALSPQKVVLTGDDIRSSLLAPWRMRSRSGLQPPSDERMRTTLDSIGLEEVELSRSVSRLSVGQSARVAFARTLLTGPQVMLLDEAEAALDDDSSLLIAEAASAFASDGGAVVRVRHRGADGRAVRRYRMSGGRLEESRP